MGKWPEEINFFIRRSVPVFIHLAAAQNGTIPYVCRGYGFRLEPEQSLLWIYILKSQWLRLKEYNEHLQALAALLTSGLDNESYQFKGRFSEFRSLTKEDMLILSEQYRRASLHLPGLAPMIHVSPLECLAVGIQVNAVFVQTPGPGAGSLVMEGDDQ